MNLKWELHTNIDPFAASVGDNTEYSVHYSMLDDASEDAVRNAVIESLNKAIGLLEKNINKNSKFLLVEWDVVYSILTIVVTDEPKANDSSNVVKCSMTGLDEIMNGNYDSSDDSWEKTVNGFAVKVKNWVSEYLNNNANFTKSSLVALFHSESRENASSL